MLQGQTKRHLLWHTKPVQSVTFEIRYMMEVPMAMDEPSSYIQNQLDAVHL